MSRRIVLTGVSRGLGRALLRGFADHGHVVCGCARSEQAIGRLRQEYPPPHDFQTVDVARDGAVAKWATRVLKDGPPDLLVNNAALINANASLWKVPPAEFDRVVDVNIKGAYYVLRHYVPAMIEAGGGVIVNFSSTWGRSTSPEVAPYCATKFAIEGLTRALSQELPRGMAAVALNPGIIHTQMLESCFGDGAAAYPSPESWARRAVRVVLGLDASNNGDSVDVGAV